MKHYYIIAVTILTMFSFSIVNASNPTNVFQVLADQSDLIIEAKVISNNNEFAKLKIINIIHGTENKKIIDVLIFPISGHKPKYQVNKTIIAFLEKLKNMDEYTTVQLNCGAFIVDKQSANENKQIISEYFILKEMKNDNLKIDATLNWFIKSNEKMSTRWIAASELSRFHWDNYSFNNIDGKEYLKRLTKNHQEVILKSILSTNKVTIDELDLMLVIQNEYPIELSNYLIISLKNNDNSDYILPILYRISNINVSFKKNRIAKKYTKQYEDFYYKNLPIKNQNVKDELQSILNKFIRDYEEIKN